MFRQASPKAKAFMAYPYFQWILLLFRSPGMLRARAYEVPGVPQLFMFGGHKRVMYHDESFLEFLATSKGSGYREFPSDGHWFQLSSPGEVANEMKDFFEKDDYVCKAPNETPKEPSQRATKYD
jgi:pimeloyl-ACP methyl ester carboxylesterase